MNPSIWILSRPDKIVENEGKNWLMYKVKGIDLSISEQTGKENKETYHAISIKLNAKYPEKFQAENFKRLA